MHDLRELGEEQGVPEEDEYAAKVTWEEELAKIKAENEELKGQLRDR